MYLLKIESTHLFWHFHVNSFACFFGDFGAFLIIDITTFCGSDWFATRSMFDLTGHTCGHLSFFNFFHISVGNFFAFFTIDFGDFEVNLSGNQFAFSPCNWFTCFITRPNL